MTGTSYSQLPEPACGHLNHRFTPTCNRAPMLPLTRLNAPQTVSVPFQPHAGPTRAIQIPIAPSDCRPRRAPPAVSSLEAYQTPTADRCNRQAQLQYPVRRLRRSPRIGGRHLITLNISGRYQSRNSQESRMRYAGYGANRELPSQRFIWSRPRSSQRFRFSISVWLDERRYGRSLPA